MTLKATMAMYE
jgi:hypothetical protein